MPGERTEQASQHRREKARKEGDLLHSRELSAAAGTLAGVMVLGMMSGRSIEAWRTSFNGFLELGGPVHWEPAEVEPTLYAIRRLSISILEPVGIVMAAVAAAALGIGILQTGGVSFYGGAVGLKLDRINPLTNITEPVFAARCGEAGQIADSGCDSGDLCCAANCPANDDAAIFDCAIGTARLGCVRTACWLLRGCFSRGLPSTMWSSGAVANRASG